MHHEQYPKFQSYYTSDVIALEDAFEQLGNPFLEYSGELLDLDQSIFMPTDVVDNVRKVKDIGFQLYTTFLNKRISSQEEAFTDTLHKANLKLFKASLSETCRKSEVSVIKNQQAKLPRLFWQPILVASSMTMYSPTKVPPFLPRLLVRGAFTMEVRVRPWTALSLQILTIRDQ